MAKNMDNNCGIASNAIYPIITAYKKSVLSPGYVQ
jgi:hypothetical protein